MAAAPIEAFIESCQAKGLDAAEALMLFKERQKFSVRCWISPKDRARPEIQDMLAIRQRVMTALDHIDSPEALAHYGKHWLAIAGGQSDIDVRDPATWERGVNYGDEGMAAYHAMCKAVENIEAMYLFVDEAWPQEHITGTLPEGAWKEVRRADPSWDDVRHALNKNQVLKMEMVDHLEPATEQDYAQLDAKFEKMGLRMVQWPWLGGDHVTMIQGLGQAMEKANEELSTATGLTGQVLGLGGRTRISVGVMPYGGCAFGGADSRASGGFQITTPPDVGMGAVAHEWVHSYDALIGSLHGLGWGHMASEANDDQVEKEPQLGLWRDMVQRLDNYAPEAERQSIQKQAYQQASEATLARWKQNFKRYEPELDIEQVYRESQDPNWNREALAQKIRAVDTQKFGEDDWTSFAVEGWMTEIDLLRNLSAHPPGESLWKTFRQALTANLDPATMQATYLDEPAEMLAHAFEIKFDPSTIIADRHAGKTGMRYPMPAEVDAQDRHWKAFFKAQAADWAKISPQPKTVAPVVSLGKALGKKAPRKAQAELDLPLAARARGLTHS